MVDNLPNAKGSIPIKKNNGVCIKHFAKSFVSGSTRKFLTPNAYPTIFLDHNYSLPQRLSPSEKFEQTIEKVKKISLQTYEEETKSKLFYLLE